MPVNCTAEVAQITGVGTVEEAETLLTWLQEHPHGQVDLSECTHLHSAVVQVLMAARPAFRAEPRPGTPAAAVIAALQQDGMCIAMG